MNIPSSIPTSGSALNIASVRTQIDAIDRELAALIVRRCGLSASVVAAKQATGDTAFGWRPAREVEILRNVMREQASLDPELAVCIWRALISTNLAAQGDLAIFTVEALTASAKAAFSVGVTPVVVATAQDVLNAVANNDHAIGVLPWPSEGDWWVTMMAPHYNDLYVCAASPLAGTEPEIMLVAARAPESAGEDISLIAGPSGACEGGVIASSGGLELVACGEFLAADAPLPKGCRLIGGFALT